MSERRPTSALVSSGTEAFLEGGRREQQSGDSHRHRGKQREPRPHQGQPEDRAQDERTYRAAAVGQDQRGDGKRQSERPRTSAIELKSTAIRRTQPQEVSGPPGSRRRRSGGRTTPGAGRPMNLPAQRQTCGSHPSTAASGPEPRPASGQQPPQPPRSRAARARGRSGTPPGRARPPQAAQTPSSRTTMG